MDDLSLTGYVRGVWYIDSGGMMMKRLMALIMGLMLLPVVAVAATIRVPADQPTIQAGIEVAADGDTVLVAPGIYYELIDFSGKSICLKGEFGYDSTAISCLVPTDPGVVTFHTGEDTLSVLDGFRLESLGTGGRTVLIRLTGSSGTIRNCVFYPNSFSTSIAEMGGFLVSEDNIFVGSDSSASTGICIWAGGQGRINRCQFRNLVNYTGGAAIQTSNYSSDILIENCVFVRNQVTGAEYASGGAGIFLSQTVNATIRNNTFVSNTDVSADGGAIGLWASCSGIVIERNIFLRNSGYAVANQHGSSSASLSCNDAFLNTPGNYRGALTPDNNSFSADPLFCDTLTENYGLKEDSPCLAEHNACASLIGASGVGCGAVVQSLLVDSSGNPTHVLSHSPLIQWTSHDVGSLAQTQFDIEVGTDSEWTSAEMWNPAPFNSSDTFVTYNGSPLLDGTTYWLRLRVNNALAWSDWKQLMFRMNSVPTIPQLRLPLAEAIVSSQHPDLIIRNSTDAESDSLLYTFEVSPDNFAATIFTFTKKQDADSLTTLIADSTLVENCQYWWRVKVSDYYESSEYSAVRSFYVNSANTAPTAVSLTQPANTIVTPITILRPQFVWTASADPDPLDSITYDLVIAVDSNFMFVQQIPNLTVTSHTLTSDLFRGKRYWWKVKSVDRQGAFNWSPMFTFRTVTLGDANNDAAVDISDAVYLIAYIFSGGLAPNPLLAGDSNCDSTVDISDVVYLIAYIFSGGSAPCSAF
jgi:hypothetical protein